MMRKSVRWLAGVLFVSWLVSGGVATAASVIENPNFDNDLAPGHIERLNTHSGNLTGTAWNNPDGSYSFLCGYRAGADGVVEDAYGNTAYVPTSQPGGGTTGLWNDRANADQHLAQTVSLTAGAWTLSFALASTFQDADFTTMATDLENGVLMLSLALYAEGKWSGPVWSLSGDGDANLVSIANLLPTDATWNTEERIFEITEDGDYILEIMMQGNNRPADWYALTNVQLTEATVPEPGTWAMLCGLGLIGGVWYRRRVR